MNLNEKNYSKVSSNKDRSGKTRDTQQKKKNFTIASSNFNNPSGVEVKVSLLCSLNFFNVIDKERLVNIDKMNNNILIEVFGRVLKRFDVQMLQNIFSALCFWMCELKLVFVMRLKGMNEREK